MSEQPPSTIGTVAQEAARLIEDMAAMARLSYSRGDESVPYPGQPAPETARPEAARPAGPAGPADQVPAGDPQASDESTEGTCSVCGAVKGAAAGHDSSSACRICPLCRGIDLLRSVRPETVDMLADLAMSVAGSLRDVAVWSRAAGPTASARSTPGGPPEPDRAPVQDIPVDDESEGSHW